MINNGFRKKLPKVSDDERPFWSIIIPTYNCAHYVKEAIQSVLIQDEGPQRMQIIVVDDASNDNIEKVVKEEGKGRVEFFKHEKNVGHVSNFHKGLELSKGYLIHILHGDDTVLWGYYKEIEHLFLSFPEIGAAYCRFHFIDENSNITYTPPLERSNSGLIENFLELISVKCILQTPSITLRREVYETIGTFDSRLKFTEDWEMWQRTSVSYKVAYSPKVLALYRFNHGSNNTLKTIRSGESLTDLLLLYELINSNAAGKIGDLSRAQHDNLAFIFQHQLYRLYNDGHRDTAIRYLKQVIQIGISIANKMEVLKVILKLETKFWISKFKIGVLMLSFYEVLYNSL